MNCESGDTCLVIGACDGSECRSAMVWRYIVRVTILAPYMYIAGHAEAPIPVSDVWFIEGPPKPCPLGKPGCTGMDIFPDADLHPLRGGSKRTDPPAPDPAPSEPHKEPAREREATTT